jgi:hypothetical protein
LHNKARSNPHDDIFHRRSRSRAQDAILHNNNLFECAQDAIVRHKDLLG